jgi:hypothetical protein
VRRAAAALQRLRLEEERRGSPYSADERRRRLEPVAQTIRYHRTRNATARASHHAARLARLMLRGHPPGLLPQCWRQQSAL